MFLIEVRAPLFHCSAMIEQHVNKSRQKQNLAGVLKRYSKDKKPSGKKSSARLEIRIYFDQSRKLGWKINPKCTSGKAKWNASGISLHK